MKFPPLLLLQLIVLITPLFLLMYGCTPEDIRPCNKPKHDTVTDTVTEDSDTTSATRMIYEPVKTK